MGRPKSPLKAWIAAQRKAQPTPDGKGWTDRQLAEKLGVSPTTVRGWEAASGGEPNSDNLEALERLFGVRAPDGGLGGQSADVAAAIDRQTEVLTKLLDRLVADLTQRERRVSELELLVYALIGRAPLGESTPPASLVRELLARIEADAGAQP